MINVDISAGYRYILSMHLPEEGVQMSMWRDEKQLCTQKSIPSGVLTEMNGL